MPVFRNLPPVTALFLLSLPLGFATAAEPVPYGAPINLAMAKKVMAAAETEAKKNNWPVVIAIVDGGGHLVLLERLDNTQWGSVEIAQLKALTPAKFRRPTRFWEERIAKGGVDLKLLKINGFPMEGGLPIIHRGKVIGAIGVSGVSSAQDAQIGRVGIATLGGDLP